ncbi:MAG: RnfABCDGE type electron transport complex subunit G [bacterium]
MKQNLEIIKIGVFLMAICVIASLALALTNKTTAPLIAEQKRVAQEQAIKDVLPGAAKFDEKNLPDGSKLFIGKNSEGKMIGKATKSVRKGYSGPISIMVGVDPEYKTTGIMILEMTETPGLGAKTKDPMFTSQFKGKTADQLYLKAKDAKIGEIDAITAATISSKAVTAGVREAVEAMKNAK